MREGKRAKRKTSLTRQLPCEPAEAAARSAPGQGIPRALLVPQAATGGGQAARGGTRHGTAHYGTLPTRAPRRLQWQRAPHARRCRSTPPARASRAEGGRPERGRCGAAEHPPLPPLLPRDGRPPPEAPAQERRPPPGAARAFPGSGRPRGGGSGAREAPAPLLNGSAMRGRGRRGRGAAGAPEAATPPRRGGPEAAPRVTGGSGPRRTARPGRLVVRRVLIFAVGAGSAGAGRAQSRGAAR